MNKSKNWSIPRRFLYIPKIIWMSTSIKNDLATSYD